MTPKGKFSEGEKVLCFHGPLIYEAKCLKVQVKEKTTKYFVHYAGWNKNWDEWVTESRVLKLNDGNLQRQKDLHKAHEANVRIKRNLKKVEKKKEAANKSGGSIGGVSTEEKSGGEDSRSSTPSTDSRSSAVTATKRSNAAMSAGEAETEEEDGEKESKKIKSESTVETEDQFLARVEIKIKLPDELKPCLVDDWDLVNRQRKLVNLPARVTVSQILEQYTKAKINTKANTPNKESVVLELVAGLKRYFNVMLGSQLLYKFERPQYSDQMKTESGPPPPMSDIYGFVHFMRLFVKLGQMLAYTQLDEKGVFLLNVHLHDVLKFLVKNLSNFYSIQDYGIAPAEYQRKAL